MDYYPFVFIINNKEYYCAWYTNDKDGFLTESNKIKIFTTKNLLFDYAKENNIQFIDEDGIARFSIDYALNWLKDKNSNIDCDYFLNFCNIISDFSCSVGANFYGDLKKAQINKVYDKLFFGNNLPAITPKNKKYYPTWDTGEKSILDKIIQDGIRILDACLEISDRK